MVAHLTVTQDSNPIPNLPKLGQFLGGLPPGPTQCRRVASERRQKGKKSYKYIGEKTQFRLTFPTATLPFNGIF